MKEIKKSPHILDKALSILIAGLLFFAIGAMFAVAYKSLRHPGDERSAARDLDAVIGRFDRAFERLKERSVLLADNSAMSARKAILLEGKSIVSVPGLILGGIARSAGKLLVFLNNNILGVGDELAGYKVVTIGKESVLVRDKFGKEQVLYLESKQ